MEKWKSRFFESLLLARSLGRLPPTIITKLCISALLITEYCDQRFWKLDNNRGVGIVSTGQAKKKLCLIGLGLRRKLPSIPDSREDLL